MMMMKNFPGGMTKFFRPNNTTTTNNTKTKDNGNSHTTTTTTTTTSYRKTFGAVPASGIEQWRAQLKGSTVRKVGMGVLALLLMLTGLQLIAIIYKPRIQYSPSFTLRHNSGADKDVPPLKWIIPEKLLPTRRWKLYHRDFSRERISETDNSSESYISILAFREYGEEIRQLLELGKHSLLAQTSPSSSASTKPSLAFRKRLKDRAPWLKGYPSDDPNWPFSTLPKPVQDGKAIMICAGEPQLAHLKTLVYAIRVIHSSTIPIRIVFRDDQDLTTKSRKEIIDSLPTSKTATDPEDHDVQFIDLSKIFDLDAASLKAGWNLKPFGLLAVAETQVMTLDVDVILLQSPDVLFQMKGYQDKGALFFHDRMFLNLLGFYDPGVFAKALQPNLSTTATNLIHYGGKSGYKSEFIMESGLVLMDKHRRAKGVWAICLLMGREDIREYAQGYYIYGDKELYFIGFETVSESYAFPRYYPGAYSSVATDFKGIDIAVSPNDDPTKISTILQQANTEHYALCGRLLHFDDSGQPLWSNGGYFTKEEDWRTSSHLAEHPLNPLWYIDGGEWMKEDFVPNVPVGSMPVGGIWNWLFGPKVNPEIRAILEGAENVWDDVKQHLGGGVNQYWRIHAGMGVMCLYSNARGIRTVPKEMATAASEATKRYFVHERGMQERELLWGK